MDAYNAVASTPTMEVFRCFRQATINSGVDPSEVAYINAHGPGTAQCDAAEAKVLDELLPRGQGVFSVKPLTGHCQGAAARSRSSPPCTPSRRVHPRSPPGGARAPRLVNGHTARVPGLMVKSSIGLGGHNAALVVDEPHP